MNQLTDHKTRIKFNKTFVRAPKWRLRLFTSVQLQVSLNALLLLSVFSQNSVAVAAGAEAQARARIPFGHEETVNIFPSQVETSDWAGTDRALSQDLDEDSLYQSFSAANSAYVPLVPPPEPVDELLPPVSGGASSTQETQSDTTSSTDAVEVDVPVAPESTLDPIDTVVPEESPDTTTVEESGPVSLFKAADNVVRGVFARVTGVFPFAQQTIISSTTPAVTESLPVDDVSSSEEETIESPSTNIPEAPEEPSPVLVETIDTEIVDDWSTSSEPEPTATSTPVATDEIPTDSVDEPAATSSSLQEGGETHEITFTDFSTAPLASGQFVTGMQLRLSLGGQLKTLKTENFPYLEILYGSSTDLQVVGTVLLDDEVSNAINGGYYLFALPVASSIDALNGQEVVIRYHGDKGDLDGIYLDAVWVEVNTKIVTQDDIDARGVATALTNLKLPDTTELLSSKLNFKRDELPTFNLRYVSQRNAIIRGVRSLFGRPLAEVNAVAIEHRSLGPSGIVPVVSVTQDGLISITISDEDRARLRPGQYTVLLNFNEGGYKSTDSFEFEWGILSVNPDKTTYSLGEEAAISIGALTPNGHTICHTNLDLYVTAPNNFINKVPVEESGECDGNNIIDVPDFSAAYIVDQPGEYKLYLERLDTEGNVLSFTNDSFFAKAAPAVSLRRVGPTRIYPPAPYPMEITVEATKAFSGTLVERVPGTFVVTDTDADISMTSDGWQELRWNLSMLPDTTETVSYSFDAPDISPYLYTLGPASLVSSKQKKPATDIVPAIASSSASSTDVVTQSDNAQSESSDFTEHRSWQIASDAVGGMMLLWADGASIPTGWTCLSCGSGQFFQRFIMGSSSASTTGGAATHTHTTTGTVFASAAADAEAFGSGSVANTAHTHTLTPTIGAASNTPAYRQLRVIQYTDAAGEPTTIPAGAIGIFDVASSSLPSGWNRYAAQDGRYAYGGNAPGTIGGSNTAQHTVTGTTGAAGGGTQGARGGNPAGAGAAAAAHTHTISTSTPVFNIEPPYITVLLGQLTADAAPPNGLIAMWTEDVDNSWIDVSSSPGDPFNQRFFKASTTYGVTGGNSSHAHSDVNNIVTSGPSGGLVAARTGVAGSAYVHSHLVNATNFTTSSNLPPYRTAVFGRRQGTDPVYQQLSYKWFVNTNSQTPSDAWPSGGTDLSEREPITATSTPVKNDDRIRLRMNVRVSNATSTAGESFKLQYSATASTCSAASAWTTVGNTSSSTLWRGYNNASVNDHSTLSTTVLASSTVAETYEENGYATSTPNNINVGQYGEWDYVLEQNGAAAGTVYCFRMIEGDGSTFLTYTSYPRLLTNKAPDAATQSKLFDNEKTATTSPLFQFVSVDSEDDDVHYQIQIDNTYDFASPVVDKNTISNSTQFENQVQPTEKAPYSSGELIEFTPATTFTNGTTYYWRVRAQDPTGSGEWGSWSTIRSFTIDTSLTASAWFQTEDEQFMTNTLSGVATGSDQVALSGTTTGTMYSSAIDFDDGTMGTAWGSLEFSDTETGGTLTYQIQYLTDSATWALVPNGDLPGNSTGFGSSPVSLLTLDTDTYNEIRIVARFVNSGSSPSLQDWQVNWGYRVETPIITKLFPNEQTGTTTPTFEFTTTDPQSDSLTYQIQWSTAYDFSASTTRTSDDAGSGFENIDSGFDTDPFNSGDTIQFTIQPANALTGSTTYWWRVRAKDTTGDNAYSFWTNPQSFTVIPGTSVSTWFQTTAEQFDTDILSGTQSLSRDVVAVATTASQAMLIYGEGTGQTPRYRQWSGSSWGSEGSMQTISAPLSWAVVRAGTTREEYVAATVGTDNDVNAQVFALGEWGNLREMTINMGSTNARGFDVAYETLSGNAMVAWCDATTGEAAYYIWNGSSWSSNGTITLASANNCQWIELASDPTSNEIIILMRDSTGGQYEAQVWNGSGWANSTTLGSITDAEHAGMAVEYEESGGQAIVTVSDGNPARFRWDSWNGTAWTGATTQAIGDDYEWGELVRDIGSDEMLLCYSDEDIDIGVVRWTGSAWAGQTELDVDGNAKNDPAFSCIFEDTPSRDNYSLVALSNTTQLEYADWNNTAWSTPVQINSIGDSATMQLIRTGTANILGLFFDDPNDSLLFSSWNGTGWSTTTTLEDDASVDTSPYGKPYFMAPRNEGREGTTIVSPGVDFNDGLGPYWDSFSWNDTQPGTSEILYHLQYQTATGSWAFIPDSVLPGNTAGTTTGPFDLSGLNTNTYNVIRPYAELSCDGSNNCPELQDWKIEWAGGITVSGTINQYDEVTPVNSGSVAVAVNGTLQAGKTGTISGGVWTIDNVTTFPGDVVTVFVNGTTSAAQAIGVSRYDGQGDMSGMHLYQRHVSLGSNDATTTPLTNADVGGYDIDKNPTNIFTDLTGTTLDLCATSGCSDVRLYIASTTRYTPGGTVQTHDIRNDGTFSVAGNQVELTGSWDNNATTTFTTGTVIFSATSTTESIDSSGATAASFYNVIFGTTTGNGTWTLTSTLDVNNNLTVSRGTLARGNTSIAVAGNLTTAANGFWTGVGSTTFDGASAASWSDQNATLQNVGNVVVDGSGKLVSLTSNVAANQVWIGADDTLDASALSYDITVYSNWVNLNTFLARSGEVFFAATTTNRFITVGGDAFHDLTFTGSGDWSFTESSLSVGNDLTISNGTVTLPANGTTTIAGSFDATGGAFAHNNGTLYFTSAGSETITLDGGAFTNVTHNLTFDGGGSWSVTDTNATSSNDVRVLQGTLTFPSGVFAIGGTLIDGGGTYVGNGGTVRFYSSNPEVLTAGGSSYSNVTFDGAGSWSWSDSDVTATGDLLVVSGSVTLPSGTFSIGGSYQNDATVNPNGGTVLFNSADGGETIDFGGTTMYNLTFNSGTGGWTILTSATTSNNVSLLAANDWTLQSGEALSVGGTFQNTVGGAATVWTGTTLSLEAGTYSINSKTDPGDSYETLRIKANTDIAMWNSVATTYVVDSTGSLYSQDHNTVDGNLYIWGSYTKQNGNEYWSYATDFDGTALAASTSRAVAVRFANGATASFSSSTLSITGTSSASTTIDNQGSGTYTVSVTAGTTTASYYEFSNLGTTGFSLLGATKVPSLTHGSYEPGIAGGSGLTIASSTIGANPNKQIFYVHFATTSAISAYNVSQTDGVPTGYWWFREGTGNLYGENFDNDTGNPGSIRFDDSALNLTISGVVYADAGVTPITGGVSSCDDVTPVVRIMVGGVESGSTTCSSVDGSYSLSGVTVIGDPTITVYLNDAPGGEQGSVITRTPTADINDMDIYTNRVIVRNEDEDPLSIANLAVYDGSDDPDLQFSAATTTDPDTLRLRAGNELYVFASSTFTPGGVVTLNGNAQSNSYDGTLFLATGATYNSFATSTLTVGGRIQVLNGASLMTGSSSVVMTATTTGKSITASSTLTFDDLSFTGIGGGWHLGADLLVLGDMSIATGTVTGTGDITVRSGSLTGDGVLSLGGGTTTIERSNSLGGTSKWTFYDLVLGNGSVVGTTTPLFVGTTTISSKLVISNAHYLDAGSTIWDLAGTGTVFVETGTFVEDTSTIRYSGNGANVLSTQYYNLDLNAGAGTPTYTAVGSGLIVDGNLTIGGNAPSTFNLTTNDPLLDVNGNVRIRSNGTLSASDSNTFTIAGSYDNDGTFTGNNGTVIFDGTGGATIAAGNSSFSNVQVNGTGSFTVTEHATATANWRLINHSNFTVDSGVSLAVGGIFFNTLGGSATTWTGSTLRLYSNTLYSANAATTSDTYGTIDINGTTQIKLWNSEATNYDVMATAALYSQDHAGSDGDLYIWGTYRGGSQSDFWSYARDFNGTPLGGSSRVVDVYLATSSAIDITSGSLQILGGVGATTTIQSGSTGLYGFHLGGIASTTMRYYAFRDMNASGVTFSGTPSIKNLSNGDFELAVTGSSTMTVGGSVITANPAKTFNFNRFALGAAASGYNITATGTALSSWRFFGHHGGIDGENFDIDPDGDPGYLSWDDSTSTISISGRVFSDEGTIVSSVCGGTANISLYVNGSLESTVTCDSGTGLYTVPDINYSPGESVIVYIDGETENAAAVSVDLVSNVSNFDLYENRVILRHEGVDPIMISDLTVWDSDNDPTDIPFDAEVSPDTLVLPADTKLIVWTDKSFEPGGDVTISGGGGGSAYDGTLELFDGANWTATGGADLNIGGNMLLGSGATFDSDSGTTTFTSSDTGRTIDVNEESFYNLRFTGSGSWTVTDPTLSVGGSLYFTAGSTTLPTGTTTVSGSFVNSGGTFYHHNGVLVLNGIGSRSFAGGGSDFADVVFAGSGTYTMSDTNATATESIIVRDGTVVLPSGVLSIGGDFLNLGGALTHNTSELLFINATSSQLLASSSDLYTVTYTGVGDHSFLDTSLSLLGSLTIAAGDVTFGTGTLSVGGSFTATGGTFAHSSGTVLFNSADSGETINPGSSSFYNVQIGAPSGGYTIVGNATTSHNFMLLSANNFTLQSGTILHVGGVFQNSVGGSATTWSGSTLSLNSQSQYAINSKASTGDQYDTLLINQNTDISAWNSAATTTIVDSTASFYSQDNAGVDGDLYIYGDYHISTTTDYWSYARDFDGTDLTGGSERTVTVAMASSATTTVDGGALRITGTVGNETTITNQGSGTYDLSVTSGTLSAQYYAFRNLDQYGLQLSGTPTITTLDHGDFELAINGGTLITLSSTTLNANASFVINGTRFATTTAISGFNVTLTGTTSNAWSFVNGSGNLEGEAFDVDGINECGSLRFEDSQCLITQQTHYRWRYDNGGLEVPTSEWYSGLWAARKRVRIENSDATTYTDAVVKLIVDYDTDMQADFDDLRFTDDSGTTSIPYWIGSTTNSTAAEVWVKVPSVPSKDTATVFMYYNNPTANSSSSITDTFVVGDDFEDGDISEYSGETTEFTVDGSFAWNGSYGLDATGNENGQTGSGGIYDLTQTISQGETLRFMQYIDTGAGSGDETCVTFGIQSSGAPSNNYAVCLEQFGTDRISLVKDAVYNDSTGTNLSSTTVDFATLGSGWYEVEVDWNTDDTFDLTLSKDDVVVASTSASDSSYTSGGIGFSFWFQNGGWDSVTARPTLTTEPTIRFGVEQTDGGASWASELDSSAPDFNVNDIARLRIAVENSGLAITDQEFLLEYAELGGAPSCEAVNFSNYQSVPTAGSCGSSPVCMATSSNITNGASTVDLLFGTDGDFTAGEAREDPSNKTGLIDLGQNQYTELEYAIRPTTNVGDPNLCFRVTDDGAEYDTYLKVARMNVRFAPSFGGVSFNDGNDIALTPGTTTRVYASSTVTDLNGYSDITTATSTMFTTMASALCSPDHNDCYIENTGGQCSFTGCSGNSCTLSCYSDFYFHADPTDNDGGNEWFVFLEVEDSQGNYDFATSSGIELLTLRALDVNNAIDYGALSANTDTGSQNATTTIINIGNDAIDVDIEGTDLTDGGVSTIPAAEQKFATSSFTYSACIFCSTVPTSTPTALEVDLAKPTTDSPPVEDDVYWGIRVPIGTNSTLHQGTNIFTAISDS